MGKIKKGIIRNISPVDLSVSIGSDLNDKDISDSLGRLSELKKEKLFLRNFTSDDLFDIMTRVGMVNHLRDRDFKDLGVFIDTDDAMIHYMKVYNGGKKPGNLIIDIRVSESRFVPDPNYFEYGVDPVNYDMIFIEWLSAQDPRGSFTKERPQLPGQAKPGLGVLGYCMEMMYIVAREIIKDGFVDIPDHLHGAIMYSKIFRFFNPENEALVRAIQRDLNSYSINDISWGLITGTILDADSGNPIVYKPSEQIYPVSERMQLYFKSQRYRNLYKKHLKKKRYMLDHGTMTLKRDEILKKKSPEEL